MKKEGLKITVECTDLDNVVKAFKIANNAIYLNDRSDYLNALYEVCETLAPDIYRDKIGKQYLVRVAVKNSLINILQ